MTTMLHVVSLYSSFMAKMYVPPMKIGTSCKGGHVLYEKHIYARGWLQYVKCLS